MNSRAVRAAARSLFVLASLSLAAQQPPVLPCEVKTDVSMPPPKGVEGPDPTPFVAAVDARAAARQPVVPEHPAFAVQPVVDRVLYDEPGETLWALGRNYKACFDLDAMTFVPYLGPTAPRNFPIRFTVTSATLADAALGCARDRRPRRAGDRVTIDRGTWREQYDLTLSAIEQSFTFDALPPAGDLKLRLRVHTDLSIVATAEGLEFRGEHGSVGYRQAFVLDAAGRREPLAIDLVHGREIELRVPQRFLATATGPITIDPIISTFTPSIATPLDFHADITFVAGSGVCVWQRVFSGNDHDIFVRWLATGTLQTLDFTSENWEWPRIAADATSGTALVVAQVGQPWLQRVIKGRIVNSTMVVTGPFQVSGVEPGEAVNCDVGGDSSGLPGTRFCVVWERAFSASDRDILFRTVNPNGTFGTSFSVPLDLSIQFDTRPRIGKTCGPVVAGSPQFWPVVWQRRFSATDEDIFGATIAPSGVVALPSFTVDFASANDTSPTVSSPTVPFGGGRAFMVAYERAMPTGDHDVVARVFRGSVSLTGAQNLSALGEPTTSWMDQVRPAVDSDGMRFVVTHGRRHPAAITGDNTVHVSTWAMRGSLVLHEAPALLSFIVGPELNPSIANAPGTTVFLAVFERVNTATLDRDVDGTLFDASFGRLPVRKPGCPLPNIVAGFLPATPVTPGTAISVFFPISWGPVSSQVVMMGPEFGPIPACALCFLGVDPSTAMTIPGGTLMTTIPADPRLVGTTIVIQSMGFSVPIPFFPFGSCQDQFLTYSDYWSIPIN